MLSEDPATPQDIINQTEALKTHHTLKRFKEIKNPTLLIAASHDRLNPKISMEEMHEQIPSSSLKIIEKSAHFAPMTRTPEIN